MLRPPVPQARSLPRALTGLTAVLVLIASFGCQGDLDSRLAEIRALQDAGQFEASIEPLRSLVTTHSSNPEVNFRLGVALVQTGRRSLAIWPLQKASQSEDYSLQAGVLLASTLLSTEDFEEAIRAADRVLSIDPDNKPALYARAHANIAAARPADAISDTEHLLSLDPKDSRALALKSGALVDLDRLDEAEQAQRDLLALAEESGDLNRASRSCTALGMFLASNDLDEKAEAAFAACVAKYPTNPMILDAATNFYVEQGNQERAFQIARAAVDEKPEDPNLRVRLAMLLRRQGQREEAEAVLKEMVELFDTVDAWRAMASFYRSGNETEKARAAIEQALERMPQGSSALKFELGDLLVEEGKLDRAREIADELEEKAYKELLGGAIALADGDPKEALALFESGLRRWPNNAGARYLAGRAAEQLGDQARARAEYREAVRNDEKRTDAALRLAQIHFNIAEYSASGDFAQRHIRSRPFTDAKAHIIAARSAIGEKNYELAEQLLNDLLGKPGQEVTAWVELAEVARVGVGPEKAVDALLGSGIDFTAPESEPALRSLVGNLLDSGRADDALARVREAAAKHPRVASYEDLEGRVLFRKRQFEPAAAAYRAALEIEPEYAPAHDGLGTIAAAQGQWKEALERFEIAAKYAPEDSDPLYRSASVKLAMGDEDGAIAQLRKVLEIDPSHGRACNDLAWLLAESGQDLDLALTLAKRATRVETGAQTLDTLGWVHLKRGDAEASTRIFERLIEQHGESPSRLYHLGLALGQKGETARAIETLRKAVSEEGFPEVEAAHAELARLEAL